MANQCRNRDLYWALRGGGGGTFGVVIEATYRTFSVGNITAGLMGFQASDAESYHELVLITYCLILDILI